MSCKIRIVNHMTCFTPADEVLVRPNYIMRSMVAHQCDSVTAPSVWYRYGQLHWINTSPGRRLSQYRVSILILNSNIAKIFSINNKDPRCQSVLCFCTGHGVNMASLCAKYKNNSRNQIYVLVKEDFTPIDFLCEIRVMAYHIFEQPTGWYQICNIVP